MITPKHEDIESAKAAIRQMLMPPPEPILSKKTKQSNDIVNTGLNIYLRRAYAFSQHPDSGGEPLGPIPSSFVP